MALNPHAEHIYEIASIWLNECLFSDGSLFWPDRQAWTSENLDSIWRAFAENLDEGSGNFVEKWADQLSGQSDDVHRIAVEVAAIYCLFPRNKQMGSKSKRKLVSDVLAFSGDLGEMDQKRWSLFERAVDGIGIGMTGAGYLAARPFHVGMYLGFAKTVKASGATSIADLEPKKTLDEAFNLVSSTMNYQPISTTQILLHILWPDRFEDYASAEYKKNMAKNLSAHFGLNELDDIDATILQARQYMEANGYKSNFSMYDDDVHSLWNPLVTTNGGEPDKKLSPKFALAAQFRERVLENNVSFLWPDSGEIWSVENATEALNLIQPLAGQEYDEAFGKLAEIAKSAAEPIFRIICDVRAASVFNRRLTSDTASRQMEMFFSIKDFNGDREALELLIDSSDSSAPGIPSYHNKMINQLITVFTGVLALKRTPDALGDRELMCNAFLAEVPAENEEFLHLPAWSLFFLMYPDQFASVPSWTDRQSVFRGFESLTAGREFPSEMSKLAFIRKKLDPKFDPFTFDFYTELWRSKWVGSGLEADDDEENGLPPTLTDLSRATHLDEPYLREIEELLKDKKQLIFEGPPGSGKTFVAEKFARYFTGQKIDSEDRNEQIEIIQFHQSYSYEDFVEGIRPETNDAGQLVYSVKKGIFREFAEKAELNPAKNFVLIIDEINRGNVSRILGELMLLLEYRDQSATLQYSQEQLRIPSNLYIIGTMNSADRSLSQIDYALRRRFYFVRFMSVEDGGAPVLEGWLKSRQVAHEEPVALFVRLNERIRQRMHTDDLQVGHSYFMHEEIGDDHRLKQVWKYAVMPLLREYFYHQKDRDELLRSFDLDQLTVKPVDTVAELETEATDVDDV